MSEVNVILKFVREEYHDDFMDGNLFMSKVENYIDLEEEQGDKEIGDKLEGHRVEEIDLNRYEVILTDMNNKRFPIQVSRAVHREIPEDLKKVPIFSFVRLTEDDFDYNEAESNYRLKDEVLNELKASFPRRIGIVITNLNEFTQKLEEASAYHECNLLYGNVVYYEKESEYPLSNEDFKQNPIKGLFYKRESYASQREYRIVAETFVEDYMFLNMGSLEGIAGSFYLDQMENFHIGIENNQ